jgi:hypothetical protein
MCACVPSVRRIVFACRPFTSAVMKMKTATPAATPPTMSAVWKRPSRRNRSATTHSNGIGQAAVA